MNGKTTTREQMSARLRDAHERTLASIGGLRDEQLHVPQTRELNPFLWMLGHVAWFHEKWVLRVLRGGETMVPGSDDLYDSIAIPWEIRWDLPVPGREAVVGYLRDVMAAIETGSPDGELSEDETYFQRLGVFHEDMHSEANVYFRQTVGLPRPDGFLIEANGAAAAGPLEGDVEIPGCERFMLGATPDAPFVFDNEKWAHPVDVAPFRIARAPVTQSQFQEFVEAGGYDDERHWSILGKLWRQANPRRHPAYWQREGGGRWLRRHFDRWVPLEPHRPIAHVNWFEAEAYCHWAGRRLPTEAEWELAAATEPDGKGGVSEHKRTFPWGEAAPTPEHANLNGWWSDTVDVGAFPQGDSAWGCRQMIGNMWEWVADPFYPYPGFVMDPYKEYSTWAFGNHHVLRGGAWITAPRLLRNTWRNYFRPERHDIFTTFRTCAR